MILALGWERKKIRSSRLDRATIAVWDQLQLQEPLPPAKPVYPVPCQSHSSPQKRHSDSCFIDEEAGVQSSTRYIANKEPSLDFIPKFSGLFICWCAQPTAHAPGHECRSTQSSNESLKLI